MLVKQNNHEELQNSTPDYPRLESSTPAENKGVSVLIATDKTSMYEMPLTFLFWCFGTGGANFVLGIGRWRFDMVGSTN